MLSQLFLVDSSCPNIMHVSSNSLPPWENKQIETNLTLRLLDKKTTPHYIIRSAYRELQASFCDFTEFHTDASKSEAGTGCAVVKSSSVIIRFSLPETYSILSSELYAIKLAINEIYNENIRNSVIYTDSLSAIMSITNTFKKGIHPIANEIIRTLNTLENRIVFAWVPNHVGIPYNELADLAAKEAAVLHPLADTPIPPSDFKAHVKFLFNRLWSTRWSNMPTTNKLRATSLNSSVRLWSTFANRRDQVVWTRLRIGHTALTHNYLLSKDPLPECSVCNSRLSVHHILLECRKFANLRYEIGLPNNIQEIFEDSNMTVLLNYIRRTKLYSLI